jgi:membrane-associated phospholipid phosphatase
MKKALLLFLTSLGPLGYFWFNQHPGIAHVVKWAIDDQIPLIKIFVIPYLLFSPIYWLTLIYALFKDRKFEYLAIATIIIYYVGVLIYSFYQTTIERPTVIGSDILSQLVRFTYSSDRQYNLLPSFHSASAVILIAYHFAIKSKFKWYVALYCAVVIVSTVLVRQHHIIDALAGTILAIIACVISSKLLSKR